MPDERHRIWSGGHVTVPLPEDADVEDASITLALWVDAQEDIIVGAEFEGPDTRGKSLGLALAKALAAPLAGPPGPPDLLRVATSELAREVLADVGNRVRIEIAPTPELQDIAELMARTLPAGLTSPMEFTHLPDGDADTDLAADLFRFAEGLFRIAPWEVMSEDHVVRLDIPALDVEGACLVIIGEMGEVRGVILFPDLDAYDDFLGAATATGPQLDAGEGWLALDFDDADEVPPELRREAERHGWPTAGAGAFPWLRRHGPSGEPRPLTSRDVRIMVRTLASFPPFFLQHRDLFTQAAVHPVCESYFDSDDIEARFCAPYEAYELFDPERSLEPVTVSPPAAGRNDPCPCGSGRKYKRCCMEADQERRRGAKTPQDTLIDDLVALAMGAFRTGWRRHMDHFHDPEATRELAAPWSLFDYEFGGATVLDRHLAANADMLPSDQLAIAEAERAAWLSLWEVTSVNPGESLVLRDLLTWETRQVQERTASRSLQRFDVILARVTEYADGPMISGLHPRILPPLEAADLEAAARRKLRRKRAVPLERVRDSRFGAWLIERWEDALEDMDLAAAVPPNLSNTSGDPLLITWDRFEFRQDDTERLADALATIPGAVAVDDGPPHAAWDFLELDAAGESGEGSLLLGRGTLNNGVLMLETNSSRRADALRLQVEDACGDMIRHLLREHTDPTSPDFRSFPEPAPDEPLTEEDQTALDDLALKALATHYESWPDHPLPALDGRTPRRAVRTADGRRQVRALLKHLENSTGMVEGMPEYDFSWLWQELGLTRTE